MLKLQDIQSDNREVPTNPAESTKPMAAPSIQVTAPKRTTTAASTEAMTSVRKNWAALSLAGSPSCSPDLPSAAIHRLPNTEIGRASCRERAEMPDGEGGSTTEETQER